MDVPVVPLLSPGLVVAIMDHEHFRLVILYKQKKKTATELEEVKAENKGLQVRHAQGPGNIVIFN